MATDFGSYTWPSSGGSSANASVGVNGSTAPLSSTEIGGIGVDGNLHGVSVDNTGKLNVNVSSSVIPTGGATSANQVLEIADLDAINTKTPALGQAVMASSSPVVIASNQSAVPISAASLPLPTGAATETTLSALNTKVPTVGQKAMAASSPVVLASDQSAVPVTVASVPLPTGAATETTLAAMSAKLPATLGQKAMAASMAVTMASDQASYPIKDGTLEVTGTVSSATNIFAAQDVSNYGNLSLQVIITGVATVTCQCSNDGTNYKDQAMGYPSGSGNSTTLVTSSNILFGPVNAKWFRAVVTSYGSGSITGTLIARAGSNSADPGLRTISVSNTVPVSQSGTWTVQPGNTPNTTAWLVNQAGYTKSNTPSYNVYSSVNVTTSAYVQLVASTTSAVRQLQIFDSSGQAMIIATGAAASEVDQIYVPPGGGVFSLAIAASIRVSVKALTATANTGYLLVDYLG